MSQPTVIIDGVEYEERDGEECDGCAFDDPTDGIICSKKLSLGLHCFSVFEDDGRNVIFVRVEK